MSMHQVCGTTAQFPGYMWKDAVFRLQEGVQEDMGMISCAHIQLCPQSPSIADVDTLQELMDLFPDIKFRLHANVRTQQGLLRWDASTYNQNSHAYFAHLGSMSSILNAPTYSLHAGRRKNATCTQLLWNVQKIQELFVCPVLVEGMYPSQHEDWLISTWKEYKWLLHSGLYFAIDLSHLNIVTKKSGGFDAGLTKELLQSPFCLEVHMSHNQGEQDAHLPLKNSALLNSCWYNVWKSSCYPTEQIHFSEGRIHTLPPQRSRMSLVHTL